MIRNSCIRSLAFAALLLLPGVGFAAQEQPESRTSVRYTVRFMDLHDAEVLAWDQCGKPAERCRVASLAVNNDNTFKGYLEVMAEAAVHEKIARALAAQDALPLTQSFQVLLLSAGDKPGATGLEIPANAQKALADLKGFLPFKSYQLLDAVWMRATQDRLTTGRISGRGGVDYQVRLRFRNLGNPKDRNLFVDAFSLMAQPTTPKPSSGDAKEGSAPAPPAARDLIETSFGLKGGETIVVGTSKVDGADEALVVLLTAVPSP